MLPNAGFDSYFWDLLAVTLASFTNRTFFPSNVCLSSQRALSTCGGLDQRWGDHGHDDGQVAMFFGAGRGAGRSGQGLRDSAP